MALEPCPDIWKAGMVEDERGWLCVCECVVCVYVCMSVYVC